MPRKPEPMVVRPTTVHEIYACPVCGTLYRRFTDAVACSRSYPLKKQFPGLKIGDVIIRDTTQVTYVREEWVLNPSSGPKKFTFERQKPEPLRMLYVVANIGFDPQRHSKMLFGDNRMNHEGHITLVGGALRPRGMPLYVGNLEQKWARYERPANQQDYSEIKLQAKEFFGRSSLYYISPHI